jgi:acyl carrier protein
MTDIIDQKISKVFSMLFAIDPSQVNEDTSPENLEAWDSIGHMHLVQALEEEFEISFSDAQVVEMLNFKLVKITVMETLKG